MTPAPVVLFSPFNPTKTESLEFAVLKACTNALFRRSVLVVQAFQSEKDEIAGVRGLEGLYQNLVAAQGKSGRGRHIRRQTRIACGNKTKRNNLCHVKRSFFTHNIAVAFFQSGISE